MGFPAISARTFPGRRVDPYRAGMIPKTTIYRLYPLIPEIAKGSELEKNGITEGWNDGILKRSVLSPTIPFFHYSIIPPFLPFYSSSAFLAVRKC
jgi:hypothetical protein